MHGRWGVEEQYYLLWPAAVRFLASRRRLLLHVTCWAIVMVWIYRTSLHLAGVPQEYILHRVRYPHRSPAVGCALAISLHGGHFTRFWSAVCSRLRYILLPLGGLAISTALAMQFGTDYRNTLGFIIDPVLVTIVLVQLLATRVSWLAWMDSPLLVYLGAISYSTYLYHKLAFTMVGKIPAGLLPPVVLLFLGLAGTYLAASLSYHVVEQPFLRLRDWISNRNRAAVPRASATA